MINIVKIISTEIDSLSRRIPKFLRFGKSDVQTAIEVSPYGVDSNPVKDMVAIYAESSTKGKSVIIGYMNKQQLAEPGEMRTYSTDADGALKFFIWQKADGTCEIGGNADNMVRYSQLETAFNQLKSDFDDLVSKFNMHVHILSLTVGTGTAAPPANTGTPSTADITPAKIDEIKTL